MEGLVKSKSTFVVTDFEKFIQGVTDGKMVLTIEVHHTRANRTIYYLNASMGDQSNRVYFALPKNQLFEAIYEEKPRLVMRVDTDEAGKVKDEAFAAFEASYKVFMSTHVEPLLKTVVKTESTLKLANFAKPEMEGARFTMINLPKNIKAEQITRLKEAKGSHILICIGYLYVMDDPEKGVAYYGASLEAGRYPFIPADPKVARPTKRIRVEEESKTEEMGGGAALV